jgi:thioredoxin-related protein
LLPPIQRAALVAVLLAGAPAFADGIAWNQDYAKASKEAAETKRPMLLDFGTEGCVYCRKLDATTFRDPNVIRLIGERFIAVNIDGEREPRLTQAMHIDSYPTLVIASPDGKVLAMQAGYVDAATFTRFVQGALQKMPAAEPPTPKPVAPERKPKLSAEALLIQAQRDYIDGFYLSCVERCDRLAREQPDAPEADAAKQLAQRAIAVGGDGLGDFLADVRRGGR